jgi:hypothetical protein
MSGRARLSALELIELVPDPGSWQSWDTQLAEFAVDADYRSAARPAPFLRRLGAAIEAGCRGLLAQEATQRNAQRTRRYQALGRAGGTAPPAATA